MGGYSTDYGSSSSYRFDDKPSTTRKTAAAYAKDDKREYTAGEGLPPIKGKDIGTDSKLVGAILLDVTGSMKEIPELFIKKMPTLYSEANAAIQGKSLNDLKKGEKLDDLFEMAVVAVGDAAGDSCPFQVLDYCKGAELVKGVLGIYPEGRGGGNLKESYDLGAYYLLNHSNTPNVPKGSKPLLIIAGDEGFYDEVRNSWVKKFIGDDLPQNLKTENVMKHLADKFDTYILRPEINYSPSQYAEIQKQWERIFGSQKVLRMKSYERMVDCLIGICGYYSDNFKTSEDLLKRRQTPAQVEEVLTIMHPLLAAGKASKSRKTKK